MANNKIRCLFVIPSLSRGGAETQAIDLVNSVDSSRFSKHLIVFEKELDQLDRIDYETVNFHHVLRKNKYSFTFIKEISNVIDSSKIDVIHCTLQISLLFTWLACFLSKKKPKLIVAIHTTKNVNVKNEIFDKFLYRHLFRYCVKIIFVCNSQRKHWVRKFPELSNKSVVVYNGVNTDHFSPKNFIDEGLLLRKRLSIRDNDFVVVCIAGFRKEKAHYILLEAFKTLADNTHLILAGDGLLRNDIEENIRVLNLSERVHLLGNVSDVRPVLSAAELSVLTSTSVETFSIAMLESMSMEVPFITSDIGGLSEAIVIGKTGDIVPVGDISSLNKMLNQYLQDKDKLNKMGSKARLVVKTKFNDTCMVMNTERVIEGVL